MGENRRRSVFNHETSQTTSDSDPAAAMPVPVAHSVLEQLNFAEPRKRAHPGGQPKRPGQVSYRGFPGELQEEIRLTARELQVSTDDLVRATLEFALGAYWSGKLAIDPFPGKMKMTLYPISKPQAQKTTKVNKTKRKKSESPRWIGVVTYRGIPLPIKDGVKQVSCDHDVPVGEVAAFLIQYGINAYRNGTLVLRPAPKTGSKTLFTE